MLSAALHAKSFTSLTMLFIKYSAQLACGEVSSYVGEDTSTEEVKRLNFGMSSVVKFHKNNVVSN